GAGHDDHRIGAGGAGRPGAALQGDRHRTYTPAVADAVGPVAAPAALDVSARGAGSRPDPGHRRLVGTPCAGLAACGDSQSGAMAPAACRARAAAAALAGPSPPACSGALAPGQGI